MSHLLIESVDSVTTKGDDETPCPTVEDSISNVYVYVKAERKYFLGAELVLGTA
jgi:hypothetical protein